MEKYVTFKNADWLSIVGELPNDVAYWAEDHIVKDAEVLRKQDVTVAPLLHTYSSILLSFDEILELDDKTKKTLQDTADWAHNAALSSERMTRKLPD